MEFSKDIKYIKDNLDKNFDDHEKLIKKLDEFFEDCDKRYAPRWAADVWIWLLRTTGAAIVVGLLGFLFYLYKNFK